MQSKRNYRWLIFMTSFFTMTAANADNELTDVITKDEFILYKDVGEFIDHSPKVTIVVPTQQTDVEIYGQGVVKTLTGSDCDRDGKMDDNQTCNAVYYKLWLVYRLKP